MCDNVDDSLSVSMTGVPARSRQTGRDNEETRCVVCVGRDTERAFIVFRFYLERDPTTVTHGGELTPIA